MYLSEESWVKLKEWMTFREADIAIGLEDFDDLKPVFEEIFEREPKPD